ncbi:MAG: alkaline phosphatase family protein [Candidatus Dormibacteraeota bacterium]|nr:alkaline phosphatase family protein [Candidatus Dormibacteraeota bacterium]MBV9525483.1 alkaline phosphatase family protein [Candidatus Dormibacteraeota bacterium]
MRRLFVTSAVLSAAAASAGLATVASGVLTSAAGPDPDTRTPIKHLVVIFQENVSFDHYFGTYPVAANTDGSHFTAREDTPSVNGLSTALLNSNPNGANPVRLSHAQPLTCDQNHDYTPEQQAFDHGLMDRFPMYTNTSSCSAPDIGLPNLVLDYYDGNTVTALWNYAQHFAMSDNSYSTVFGPSTPGALNLVSGQTHGATPATLAGVVDNGSVYGDADPAFDDCSSGSTISLSGQNVGDLLNAAHVTWGWFQGGFRPTAVTGGKAVCGASHANIGGSSQKDYSAHHEPFQYYASTSNPHHLAPANDEEIGHNGQANHQYDLADFTTALGDEHLPAVSFLKAARYQDGHAGYSDPLDEQQFLVRTINALQRSDAWESTAVVIAYDDSDGWYDHVMSPIVNDSQSTEDALSATGQCGTAAPLGGFQDRCGYGPRQPLLVISPFSRENFVDHSTTDQSSILRFIEDNWSLPRIGGGSFDALAGPLNGMFDFGQREDRHLLLDPASGKPQ